MVSSQGLHERRRQLGHRHRLGGRRQGSEACSVLNKCMANVHPPVAFIHPSLWNILE